jgi:hypothetical protein
MDRRGGEEMLFPVGLMEIQQHWLSPGEHGEGWKSKTRGFYDIPS